MEGGVLQWGLGEDSPCLCSKEHSFLHLILGSGYTKEYHQPQEVIYFSFQRGC